MIKSLIIFILALFLFSPSVLAECTLPMAILPPDLAYGSLLVMDGYEWSITETRSENTVTRDIFRKSFEYPEDDAYISEEEAVSIASLFFERNERVLGIPESLTVEAEEGVLPVPISFLSTEKQYCEGLEVIGTVSGTLNIGGGDEYQVSSLIISWYVSVGLDSLSPTLSAEEIIKRKGNEDAKPELAILPTDDDFKLVWKVKDNEGGVKLIDAETGEETSAEKENRKSFLLKILVLVLGVFVVVSFGYFFLRKK